MDTHDYGVEVPPKSRMDLTKDAHAVHKLVGYKGDRPFPIVHFFELVLPLLYDDFDLEIVSTSDLGEKFGETYPDRHLIRLGEEIYDGAVGGDPFSRMTIAHEVGHLLEHEGVPRTLARNAASKSIPAYKSSEWQANAFAGALLMPASKILDLTPDKISEFFQVTKTAARTQCTAAAKEEKWCRALTL